MNIMNILMIHPHDVHSPAEPWTRRIRNIAREFVKKGYQVRLVYFPLSSEKYHTHGLEGIELVPLERLPSPVTFLKNTLKLIKLSSWADIIHLQKCHHYAAVPAAVAAFFAHKPLHYDWDDWEEMIWYESCGRNWHSKFIGTSFKVLEKSLPLFADTVSVASQYLKSLALKAGVKEENIFNAPVGADIEEFNPFIDGSAIREKYKVNNALVLYIGQLHGAQYLDLFLRAANIVLHEKPEATFMVVGEGFMEGYLKGLARNLGIEKKVIFTGAVLHHKIPEYIAAADICVAPFKDTLVTRCKSPLKIVEYMAMGKAIVASDVGEARRMLAGVGILVKPQDFHSLAEGIMRLLKDNTLREPLGFLARKRAEKSYNWSKTAESLLAAYRKVLR